MEMEYYKVMMEGGLKKGGKNLEEKMRRKQIDKKDMIIGNIGGMD